MMKYKIFLIIFLLVSIFGCSSDERINSITIEDLYTGEIIVIDNSKNITIIKEALVSSGTVKEYMNTHEQLTLTLTIDYYNKNDVVYGLLLRKDRPFFKDSFGNAWLLSEHNRDTILYYIPWIDL